MVIDIGKFLHLELFGHLNFISTRGGHEPSKITCWVPLNLSGVLLNLVVNDVAKSFRPISCGHKNVWDLKLTLGYLFGSHRLHIVPTNEDFFAQSGH